MKEQASPSFFDLYGNTVTTYVNGCMNLNRTWLNHAASLTAALFASYPRPASATAEPQDVAAPAADLPAAPAGERTALPTATEPDADILNAVRDVMQLPDALEAPSAGPDVGRSPSFKRSRKNGPRRKP